MNIVLHASRRPTTYQSGYRAKHDFYPTPPEATRALLSVEHFHGSIWECACGDGAIATELKTAGYSVTATDLIYRGYGAGRIDFLKQTKPLATNIITNPPYGFGLADQFVDHALALTAKTGGSVAMLLNLQSLCSPRRHWRFVEHPPAAIYALDHIVCWPHGDPKFASTRTASHRYAWLVWRPGHIGRPSFWWLSADDFREPTAIDSNLLN